MSVENVLELGTGDGCQENYRYQGTFHAKMGTIKDRKCMDLTEAETIKKRWQEYAEELSKKIFMTQIIMMVYHSLRSGHPGM